MRLLDKFYWKIVWILTGLLFAAAGSLMFVSGTFNLNHFYDVGAIHDISQADLKVNWNDTMHFDAEKQVWIVDADMAIKHIGVSSAQWKYLYMPLSNVSSGTFSARIDCYDESFALVYQMQSVLEEGENLLTFPGVEFNRVDIVIENQKELSFDIENAQFREKPEVFSKDKFVKGFIVLAMAFFSITGILCLCLKNKRYKDSWYMPVQALQTLYMYVGNAGKKLTVGLSPAQRGFRRSILFCFMLLLSQVSFVLRYYFKSEIYRFHVLSCVIILVLIALLCYERPLKYLNWKNKLVVSWMCMWILSIISDFLVEKQHPYTGYVMIFVFGFLFFMLGNMKNRTHLILDFIRAIEWSFWPNVVFCYLFRPHMPGYRYLGVAAKPGFFAMYLLFVWIAFLADMHFDLHKKRTRKRDFYCVFALGICFDFMWKTQTISALLPAALAALIFSLKFWMNRKKVRIIGLVAYLLVFSAGYLMSGFCVYHIPRALGTEVKFYDDLYLDSVQENPFVIDVRAAEPGNDNRLLYKLKTSVSLEELLSGRTLYWKAYVRDLNLLGHEKRAYFMGGARYPHNGVLSIMHRYGIFAGIPCMMLVIYFLGYSWRYFRRHYKEKKYAFFVLTNMICCITLMLVENQELPFSWVFWYAMYIVIGVYFDDEKTIRSE